MAVEMEKLASDFEAKGYSAGAVQIRVLAKRLESKGLLPKRTGMSTEDQGNKLPLFEFSRRPNFTPKWIYQIDGLGLSTRTRNYLRA